MTERNAWICTVGGLAGVLVSTMALAHTDDPKAKSLQPRYEGPGYRQGVGGPLNPGGFTSDGVTLRSWLPLAEFNDSDNANDCWGYVSPSGREYAILGLERGNGFVEVTDPDNPVIVAVINGPRSLWGDMKVYQNYCYAVTESDRVGIQVIDLSDIDNGNVTLVNEIEANVGTGNSHNVVIDEDSGYLYRVGGYWNGMGVYDLNADPVDPPLVGAWTDRYIHDMQVVTMDGGRQVAFTCSGDNGGWENPALELIDVTDKSNIVTIGARVPYANSAYSHQAWLSEDRQYLYLNDELDGLPETRIFNVATVDSPFEVGTFTHNTGSIDHNLYTRGGFIFEANYSSGLRVFDASDPENPVEVAWFDTYPESDVEDFYGLWSNYPMLPSGLVIGSDEIRGLFVWSVDVLETGCPNDLDQSGVVDFGDILAVLSAWGQSGGDEDLDGSGVVDFGDVLVILGDWGTVCD